MEESVTVTTLFKAARYSAQLLTDNRMKAIWLLPFFVQVAFMSCAPARAAEIDIILRMDDSGFGRHAQAEKDAFLSDAEITRRVIRAVTKHNAKLTIAVIPNAVSGSPAYHPQEPEYLLLSSCDEELDVLRDATANDHVEIVMHGWTHEGLTRFGRRPSEFAGRSFEEQAASLASGKRELERSLEIPIDVFVPPFNNHDRTTLSALKELDFATISSIPRKDDSVEGLYYVPSTTDLRNLRNALAESRRYESSGLIVAVFHGFDFAESGSPTAWLDLTDLDTLLGELSGRKDRHFTTFRDVIRRAGNGFDAARARLYAAYAYRVGRVMDILPPLGVLGKKLESVIPSRMIVYPTTFMRRSVFFMFIVEAVAATLLFVVCVAGLHMALRLLARYTWARSASTAALVGSGACFGFFLVEGIFGIVGEPGFGSRLVLAMSCAAAGVAACVGHTFGRVRTG